jgi:RNA polymerase sigma-70 factor, ECF subfamily
MKGEILQRMGEDVAFTETFEGLYRSSVAEMTRLAYLITGSAHVAEEITHDAFIAVQRRWDSINTPKPYLRQVVVNGCRSYLRHLRIERTTPIDPIPPVINDEIDETWLLVQQLSPKRRTALVLRYYLDLSIDEIADVMRTRPGTVKSLLHRGREALRGQLS